MCIRDRFSGTPGVFNIMGTFLVTGGTGYFHRAGGSFSEVGPLDFRTQGRGIAIGAFTGKLDVVPEPATWAMLVTGFGVVGAAARRRRQTVFAA